MRYRQVIGRISITVLAVLVLAGLPAYAHHWQQPDMDKLGKAVKTFENVKQGGYKFTDTQREDLELLIDSGDTFSLALAAYAVGNAPRKEDRLLEMLKNSKLAQENPCNWPAAFVQLAEIKQGLLDKDDKYRISVYEKIVKRSDTVFGDGENAYLTIEAAKEILKLDKGKGLELLEELQDISGFEGSEEARGVVSRIRHPERPQYSGSRNPPYDIIQWIVDGLLTVRKCEFLAIDSSLSSWFPMAPKQKP